MFYTYIYIYMSIFYMYKDFLLEQSKKSIIKYSLKRMFSITSIYKYSLTKVQHEQPQYLNIP